MWSYVSVIHSTNETIHIRTNGYILMQLEWLPIIEKPSNHSNCFSEEVQA